MPAASCARRSSIGLTPQSLVNQALRGLEPPSFAEPGASAPGGGGHKLNSPAVSRLSLHPCGDPLNRLLKKWCSCFDRARPELVRGGTRRFSAPCSFSHLLPAQPVMSKLTSALT